MRGMTWATPRTAATCWSGAANARRGRPLELSRIRSPCECRSLQYPRENVSLALVTGRSEVSEHSRCKLRSERLSYSEARERRFVLAKIVERTGDDSLLLHLLH